MQTRQPILALAVVAMAIATAQADKKASAKPKRLTARDCEKLVEQLVNREKAPFKRDYVLDLPEGMSKHEKTFKKIREAYDALSENAAIALPILMKHIDDERYSFVQEQPSSGVYSRISVGSACSTIVEEHVEAHLQKTFCHDGEGRPRGYYFIWHSGGLSKWWKPRKDKSLAELQLEAMEWVMKQKKPEDFKSEEAWKKALEGVKRMADEIRKTKKPIVVEHRVYFFGS